MAGVSRLGRAKSTALTALQALPPEYTVDAMRTARDRVYELHRTAAEMRGAYKTNKSARESVRHTYESSLELKELLDLAIEHWDVIDRAKVSLMAYAIVQFLDTMEPKDQAIADSGLERLRHLLPAPSIIDEEDRL
jgi:IS5 family transposase